MSVKVESTTVVKSRKSGESRSRVEAQREYVKAWSAKQAQIAIRVPPEWKAALDAHLSETGEGITPFIKRAVEELMAKEKTPTE